MNRNIIKKYLIQKLKELIENCKFYHDTLFDKDYMKNGFYDVACKIGNLILEIKATEFPEAEEDCDSKLKYLMTDHWKEKEEEKDEPQKQSLRKAGL